MYEDLQGKVVILTGAAGNLGQAAAHYFGAAGSVLVLLDRNREHLIERFGEDYSDEWLVLETDVTDPASVEAMIAAVLKRSGRIDVLVNIAGGYAGGHTTDETPLETWEHMLDLNAKSVFVISAAVVKVMVAGGRGGRIINIGAKPGLQGTKAHSAYSAAKSAVLRLTESMAAEYRDRLITVNAVIPSMLDTPPNRKSTPDADFSKWVTPESLAGVIGFLASDAARDISGALIPVYGRS